MCVLVEFFIGVQRTIEEKLLLASLVFYTHVIAQAKSTKKAVCKAILVLVVACLKGGRLTLKIEDQKAEFSMLFFFFPLFCWLPGLCLWQARICIALTATAKSFEKQHYQPVGLIKVNIMNMSDFLNSDLLKLKFSLPNLAQQSPKNGSQFPQEVGNTAEMQGILMML